MKLVVYKGFAYNFFSEVNFEPLVKSNINIKKDIFKLDDEYKDELEEAIILKKDFDKVWITYEEYELAYEMINVRAKSSKVSIEIINNNIYPDIYPCEVTISDELYNKYSTYIETSKNVKPEKDILVLDKFYSRVEKVNGIYFVNYHNFEAPNNPSVDSIKNFYSDEIVLKETKDDSYVVDIGDNVVRYIEHLLKIQKENIKNISYKMFCKTEISNLILNSLKAFAVSQGALVLNQYCGDYVSNDSTRKELIEIATDVLKISNFKFRDLKFYKQPEISKEMESVSQAEIMEYIVNEAEKAYRGERYRDIFMTAPTGAGKSLIFQIPSIYLAKKYNKLIIIIEPLKGLQLDQQKNLEKAGYFKSAFLNSDVATMVERENIVNDVKNGKIDILYVSPETLLSHSIESLIGDREIGLVIVDEAHIVTTWGVGFRPDYWYLGSYLNKMKAHRDKTGKEQNHHDFPIFACTATAVNGGPDDTVSETVISLYMNDPIIKIGSPKRENIKFDITNYSDETYDQYKEEKVRVLGERLNRWINNREKTIVYCPFSSIAHQMRNGEKEYRRLDVFKNDTCVYTGSGENSYDKNEAMRRFKESEINVMYATKAFGMGIDIPDIKNIYHYAVSGGLSDYIQEIGRAAREKDIEGKSIVDYFNGDMKYMNVLFGMSQIKQYHIKKCLSIIYDTYKNKGEKRNFLINPKMFDGVFGKLRKEEDLTNKLKIVLLMLEKDFLETYKIYVLISRPSSLFTKAYLCIDKEKEKDVLKGEFGKYFKRISSGRKEESDVYSVKISDKGDIFELDLKTIWEDKYGSDMSFAKFKFDFYKNSSFVLKEYSECVYSRVKLKIKSKKSNLEDIFELAKNEIDFLTDKLSEFGREFFTKDEFKEKIRVRYLNNNKAEVIANSYFDVVDANGECIKSRENNDIIKYQISNGRLRELGMRIIRSGLVRQFTNIKTPNLEKFYAENVPDNNLLKLLSLLDLISYEIEGGNSPEIFIRLNAPDKIKNIVEDKILYKNKYVELAREKHYRSIKIFDYFFKNFDKDDNNGRWNFVEEYFLGEDVESKIDIEEEKKQVKQESISNFIKINSDKTYPLGDYSNWDSIIEHLFLNANQEKYIYYCKVLKNNNIKIPDYAYTEFELSKMHINTLFIYENSNLLIVDENFGFENENKCKEKGWTVIKIDEIEKNIEMFRKLTNG